MAKQESGPEARVPDTESIGPTAPIWVDHTQVFIRADPAVAMIVHTAKIPNGPMLEVSRLQVSIDHLRKLAEVIDRMLKQHQEDIAQPGGGKQD